jgi:Polyketide cyclase / dehydrase and lipid transport
MSVPTDIDRSAPVLAHHEIDIAAPLEVVWALHTDVNGWTGWQADISSAHIDGAFEVGNSFDWSSYGFPVTSTIYEVSNNRRVLWGGGSGGITGVHEWLFAATPSGTHVSTNESFAGSPVEADAVGMQRVLDSSLVAWLEHMKTAAESRR